MKERQLTWGSDTVGRWETFFDFSGLPIWGAESARKITRSEWHPLINLVWSMWEAAHALAFIRIPETQQRKEGKKSDTAKKLIKLANTASIRSSGRWCSGEEASPSEKEWAKTVWPFPMDKPAEGINGTVPACEGVMG